MSNFNWNNDSGPNFPGGRNNHYRNAYPNYEGGYGSKGSNDFVPNNEYFMRRSMFVERAANILLDCGVHQNDVKNLPASLLALIEPGFCGICGMALDCDNSRYLHYTSKNHIKKQHKWLQEFNDSRKCNPEAPLKARELYCELCDVQITSQSHAESHYSGKPHRSVVAGRTAPKNPILNQFGMEKRVQQLIRREKRKLPEDAKEEDPVIAEKKKNKGFSPDLYCDVCKVTVTCFDQMTNHLNGKKHLSKEKQHIFNMMKTQGNVKKNSNQNQESPLEEASVSLAEYL